MRHAEGDSQEWGRAMAREMDCIDGDWAALYWAAGSATALFRGFQPPIHDVSQISNRMQSLGKKVRRRNFGAYAACLIIALSWIGFFFTLPNPIARLGSILILLSVGIFLGQVRLNQIRMRESKILSAAHPNSIEAYRVALQHQRQFHSGIWLWSRIMSLLPGYLIFCAGFAISHPEVARPLYWIQICAIVLAIAAMPLNLRLARRFQRQIGELHSLTKED
jgi:hypothetical protein